MSHAPVLLLKKLKGSSIVRTAADHNKRSRDRSHKASSAIDTVRTNLNQCLHGPKTAKEVSGIAKGLMRAAGIKLLRKDAVRAIEVIVSLPPSGQVAEMAYFRASFGWVAAYFGGISNVLSADVHFDETAPHMHVLVLPLFGGRMRGSEAVGGPAKLKAMHQSFHDQVANAYGGRKPTRRAVIARDVQAQMRPHDAASGLFSAQRSLCSVGLHAGAPGAVTSVGLSREHSSTTEAASLDLQSLAREAQFSSFTTETAERAIAFQPQSSARPPGGELGSIWMLCGGKLQLVPRPGRTDRQEVLGRRCEDCKHGTTYGHCGNPVAARAAKHAPVDLPPLGHAASCPTFQRREPLPFAKDFVFSRG